MSHEQIAANLPENVLRAKGYSLWIVPEKKELDELTILIQKLSERFKSPLFVPHMTLVGGISQKEGEIEEKTKRLASNLKPFEVELEKIDYEEIWNRTLYIRGKDSSLLSYAFERSDYTFETGNIPPFPHMSLAYGAFSNKSKEEAIREIGENYPAKFRASSLHLFYTQGHVDGWIKIEEFPLK